jgi:hypothetical protein
LQHQSVDLTGNLGLFRVERYALCIRPTFFGILLLLLYVLTFKASCHVSILRLIGVRHLKSLFPLFPAGPRWLYFFGMKAFC